jgi:hypothetical protein
MSQKAGANSQLTAGSGRDHGWRPDESVEMGHVYSLTRSGLYTTGQRAGIGDGYFSAALQRRKRLVPAMCLNSFAVSRGDDCCRRCFLPPGRGAKLLRDNR